MSVTTATDRDQLDLLADRWDKIRTASPHAGRALFTVVLRTSPDAVRPHVMLIEREHREPILVVARIERRPVRIKAGYRTLLQVPARWLVLVAGGVVGAQTSADYDLVVKTLIDGLIRGEADVLHLAKVETGGPLQAAADRQLRGLRRGRAPEPEKHHRSDLSGGFSVFLAARSKRTRLRLRRRLERLAEPDAAIEIHRVGPGDDAAEMLRIHEAIGSQSYQRPLGVGFFDDPLHRELMGWAVDGGPFHAWILSVAGVPTAFVNGLMHEGVFFIFHTAFDPRGPEEEPGALLLAHVLRELAEDPLVDAFDYGFGDALYKQQMSDVEWAEADIFGFARRPVPLALNTLMSGATASVGLAKRVLGAERVQRLRQRRRAELRPTTEPEKDPSARRSGSQ